MADTLPRSARFWPAVRIVAALACIVAALGFPGRLWWRFELLGHFRVQYLAGFAALTALLLLGRKWRFAALTGAFALLHLLLILPLYFGGPAPHPGNAALRAVSLNLQSGNRMHGAVLDFVRQSGADVLLFMEASPAWMNALEPLKTDYPHWRAAPRRDNFGIAFFSRRPCRRIEIRRSNGMDGVPYVVAEVEVPGGALTVFGVHPVPPVSRAFARRRNGLMAQVAEEAKDVRGPVMAIGDLNMTSWSPVFRDFLKETGLRDSRKGFGVQATWPVFNPILRVPIDHCLVSPGIAVRRRKVGPRVGSDHFPIVVDVAVAAE